jgi:hypothetical protein
MSQGSFTESQLFDRDSLKNLAGEVRLEPWIERVDRGTWMRS